ncbi:hypothetical protein KC19_1G303000 [Ceratodon purpureus]|uniref:Uncharacterized protein n=1 Tax=Ceratodon purpureus TaxID=3225 RepID=A0A8T0JAY3_CERPU|nr:hypothetical protein KC19_1G303000 [Ceratodon purpureus]
MADQSDNLKACPAKPRVVVGLDFGTTYSGFAFAHISDPEKVYTYYDYPRAGGEKPYCKTLTASYYKALPPAPGSKKGRWQLHSWGYPARTDHERDIQALHKYMQSQNPTSSAPSEKKPTSSSSSHAVENFFSRFKKFSSRNTSDNAPSVGVFLSRFKLHLASRKTEASSASPLPTGLTIEQVITDYLRELGGLILQHLQKKYGAHFSKELIQWCITVPSIWDNSAKATMRACMVAADLMGPHPIVIVLEPEAASFYSQRLMGEVTLEVGNKLVVADIGGGTSDIVAQEVVSVGKHGYKVKEVTMSSGGLCGGTYVDSRFIEFLESKIGRCFPECILKHRNVYGQLMKEWECTKSYFDCGQGTTTVNLPNRLAMEWERSNPGSQEYGEVEISFKELQSIFDPIVQENLDLIQRQLAEVGSKVRFLVLVGGFTESPYLLHRIKQTFGAMVESIICPPNPGSAICQGAVALALNPGAVVSRICKRTYGYEIHRRFEKGVDPIEKLRVIDGEDRCYDRFKVLVKKGDVVMIDKPMTTRCYPNKKGVETIPICLFSCDDRIPPRYTTDKLMKKEGKLKLDVSKDMELDTLRSIEVSLVFGGSFLEVKAEAVNFKAETVKLPVQVDYLLI